MTNNSQLHELITELRTTLENHPTPDDSLSTKTQELLTHLQYQNDQASITVPTTRLTNGGQGLPLYQSIQPLLAQCQNVDIIASFTRLSGVNLIKQKIRNNIYRGGTCRILTGDYLGITQPEALSHLLNLKEELALLSEENEQSIGIIEIKIITIK